MKHIYRFPSYYDRNYTSVWQIYVEYKKQTVIVISNTSIYIVTVYDYEKDNE